MPSTVPVAVTRWHEVVEAPPEQRAQMLGEVLAPDAVFRSPAVHAAQEGRAITRRYLEAAMTVLGPTLRYERQLYGEDSAVLEFTAVVTGPDGEREVHGIDFLRWDADDRIVEFTVMVRPLRGLEVLVAAMGETLKAHAGG